MDDGLANDADRVAITVTDSVLPQTATQSALLRGSALGAVSVTVKVNDGPHLARASRRAAPAGAAETIIYSQADISSHSRCQSGYCQKPLQVAIAASIPQMVWDRPTQINLCDKKVTNVTHSGMISDVMKS